jgi:hypothetical protein
VVRRNRTSRPAAHNLAAASPGASPVRLADLAGPPCRNAVWTPPSRARAHAHEPNCYPLNAEQAGGPSPAGAQSGVGPVSEACWRKSPSEVHEAASVPRAPVADTAATSSVDAAGPIGACINGNRHGSSTPRAYYSLTWASIRHADGLTCSDADRTALPTKLVEELGPCFAAGVPSSRHAPPPEVL